MFGGFVTEQRAQPMAIFIGSIMGLVEFGRGLSALFVVNSLDSAIGVLTIFGGVLLPLPLTIMGIFKPRAAAFGLFLCPAMLIGGLVYEQMRTHAPQEFRLMPLLIWFFLYIAPPLVVGALLLYSVRSPQTAQL